MRRGLCPRRFFLRYALNAAFCGIEIKHAESVQEE
jgi:hypothetical protein